LVAAAREAFFNDLQQEVAEPAAARAKQAGKEMVKKERRANFTKEKAEALKG